MRTGGAGTVAWRPVALVAAVSAAAHLAVATRFGWHHDEFYYVICGRHPAFGYVDQPPLAPLLARFADAAGGLLGMRLLTIGVQAGCVVLTAVLAALFGGRGAAQTLAAAAVAACPVFVAASLLLGTTGLDQLVWAAVFVLVVRALADPRPTRWWAAAGVAAGVGLETKDTVAVLVLGIGVGLLWYRREVLRTPGPWLALAIAAVLAAPNVVWDALHGWPNLTMDRELSRQQGGPLGSLLRFAELPLLLAGTALIGVWYFGLRWLAAPENRAHRWLSPTTGVVVAVFIAGGGKVYYAAPLLVALFAAGAVRMEAVARERLAEQGVGAEGGTAAGDDGVGSAEPEVAASAYGGTAARTSHIEPTETVVSGDADRGSAAGGSHVEPTEAAVARALQRVEPPETEATAGTAHLGPAEAAVARALRREVRIPIAISFVISLIVGLPVLPAAAATALRPVNPELMQTYGWSSVARQVADASAALPADVPIFAGDFGEAGALTILGPAQGLHRAVYSGHDSYTYWGPPPGSPDTVLCVGTFQAADLRRYWDQVDEIAPITLPHGLKNAETVRHAAIYLCRRPHGTWAQLWPQLRHVD